MARVRFLQLDVFTDRPGGGNPLGVVLGADDWAGEDMQRFAAWTNLVETTFVLPPSTGEAHYRLRIFTPAREIPFAGHPTIGSAHAVLSTGFSAGTARLVQECGAGLLPIDVEDADGGRRLFVQAPGARVLKRGLDADPQLRGILGELPLGQLPPAYVEGGRCWWLAELASEADVRGWHPNHAAIAALAHATDSLGLCVFARCDDPDYELVVRAFPAGVGIVEDPASGAANGLIAAYIAQAEPGGALSRGYRVSQGREIGHDAQLQLRIEAGERVWVGGRAQLVIDGHADWPLGVCG